MQAANSGVRTAWRNAACVVLFNGPFRYTKSVGAGTRFGEPRLPNCLETTTRPGSKDELADILFVQRHAKSGFMANTYVFPGGVIDEADYSRKWFDLFTSSSTNPFSSILSLRRPHQPRLPLYSTVPDSGPIVGEVAFRICAIREMFEETGVLLARDRESVSSSVELFPGSFSPAVKVLPEGVREEWRKRVSSDAHEFLNMCSELHCVPDIWSLIEWSDWLTPRNITRRYDTVFYMCFVENRPPASPNVSEVTRVKWMNPFHVEELYVSGEIKIAPPQFAELRGLQLFPSTSCLHSYALSHCCDAVRKLSSRLLTKDNALISVREEDDLYPLEGSEDHTTKLQHPRAPHLRDTIPLLLSLETIYELKVPSHTVKELRELSNNMSRMELRGPGDYESIDTVEPQRIAEYIKRYREQVVRERSKL